MSESLRRHTLVFDSASTVAFPENGEGLVLELNATDSNGGTITYSISGDDAENFNITENGRLTFLTSPDYDDPRDVNKNNLYQINVTALNNGSGEEAMQEITILVIPEVEEGLNIVDKVGTTTLGRTRGEQIGQEVSISANGEVMAFSGLEDRRDDIVRVYKLQDGVWQQLGDQFDLVVPGNELELVIDLSYNGKVLAIGSPGSSRTVVGAGVVYIYEWDGADWVLKGSPLTGTAAIQGFGSMLSMSATGDVIAIGDDAENNSTGVYAFSWNGMDWEQQGGSIAENATSLSLSATGNILAVAEAPESDQRFVRVYEWSGEEWTSFGTDLTSNQASDEFGEAISLSADGTTIAVGAPGYEENSMQSLGAIDVFVFSGGNWIPRGEKFVGDESYQGWGSSLSLSADGTALIWGFPGANEAAGEVIYRWWNGSEWEGDLLAGETGKFGYAVDLSADGRMAVVGTPETDINFQTDDYGSVEVFRLVNRAPIVSPNDETEIVENSHAVLFDVNAVDGEGGSTDENVEYSLPPEGDNIHFNVNDRGIVSFNVPPDFESPQDINGDNTYELEVLITDYPVEVTHRLVVSVTDSDTDFPVFKSSRFVAYPENGRGPVTDVTANDGKGGLDDLSVTYSLSGEDARFFTIGESGLMTLSHVPDFDKPIDPDKDNLYYLTITANDGGDSQNITTQDMSVLIVPSVEEGLNMQAELGNWVEGREDGDAFGTSVSLNAIGTIMAIGAPADESHGERTGYVRLVQWQEDDWVPWGVDIEGEQAGEQFGTVVSLSYDGHTLAVASPLYNASETNTGAVRVYTWNGSGFVQKGAPVYGKGANDQLGTFLQLSADGNRLLAGGPTSEENRGQVRFYEWTGTDWLQYGEDIEGDVGAAALSGLGEYASIAFAGSETKLGTVRVMSWNGSAWIQRGQTFRGEVTGDLFGEATSISADGSFVAVSAPGRTTSRENAGQVRIFKWINTEWVQQGNDVNGANLNGFFGTLIKLSADGQAIAYGRGGNPQNTSSGSGIIAALGWRGNGWSSNWSYAGVSRAELLGPAIDYSADGRILVSGVPEDGTKGTVKTILVSNRKPEMTSLSQVDFIENSLEEVLDVEVIDGDGGAVDENINYRLGWEGDNLLFSIDETGIIRFNYPPDFEKPLDANGDNVYVLEVRIMDEVNLVVEEVLINVRDSKIDPPIFTSPESITFLENSEAPVLDVNANDGEGGADDTSISYRLEGPDESAFHLGADGVLTFKEKPDFDVPVDADKDNVFDLTIVANNGNQDHNITQQDFHVVVYPLVEEKAEADGIKIGETIVGKSYQDFSGANVSFNANGSILAIGAHNGYYTRRAGHVRVFERIGDEWEPMGELEGIARDDHFGGSLDLSYSGKTIAVGAFANNTGGENAGMVRVFDYVQGQWVQRGNQILGMRNNWYGSNVRISANGNTVAFRGRQETYIYRWNGTEWLPLWKPIELPGNFDTDALGTTIVMGVVPQYTSGYVRVYEWSGLEWTMKGEEFKNDESSSNYGRDPDGFGSAVSMSADGRFIAIGATRNHTGYQESSGKVIVYEWKDDAWVQRGDIVTGELEGTETLYDHFGRTVNLSADGSVLAIGASGNRDTTPTGRVHIFEWDGTNWVFKFLKKGAERGDLAGSAIGLSADGSIIASGSPRSEQKGYSTGSTTVYAVSDRAPVVADSSLIYYVDGGTDAVLDLDASNGERGAADQGVTYTLGGGADASLFSISQSGVITFKTPPEFSNPQDADVDNTYEAYVEVADDQNTTEHFLEVRVIQEAVNVPIFNSPASTTFLEGNTGVVLDINAAISEGEPDDTGLAYSLSGIDAGHFDLTNNGALTFRFAPSFEMPADENRNNVYYLNVIADNGKDHNNTSEMELKVVVLPNSADAFVTDSYDDHTAILGGIITGKSREEHLGTLTDLNASGTVMAVGNWFIDDQSATDQIHVYEWDGGDWRLKGNAISQESGGRLRALQINYAGDMIVTGGVDQQDAGYVQVYFWNGIDWQKQGGMMRGDALGDAFGTAVSINAEGDVIAVGASKRQVNGLQKAGTTQMFKWNGTAWSPWGPELSGTDALDEFGHALSLDALGETVAVGAINATSSRPGYVQVYRWDGSDWNTLGSEIDGFAPNGQFGFSVALSGNGNALAIGAPFSSVVSEGRGFAEVYTFDGARWDGESADIDDSNGFGNGYAVDITADGMAFSSSSRESSEGRGRIWVGKKSGNQWELFFSNGGNKPNDRFGTSLALSGDGRVLSVGAPYTDGPADNAGEVSAYSLTERIPTEFSLSTHEILENQAPSTLVGRFLDDIPDFAATGIYHLVTGDGDTDNDDFEVIEDQLFAKSSFDFESKKDYSIRVRFDANSGATLEKSLAIKVTNQNEIPDGISIDNLIVNENSSEGTVLANIIVSDPDEGDTYTLSLSDDIDSEAYFLDIVDGQLIVNEKTNFELRSRYRFLVVATDAGGLSLRKFFVISVVDENEAPTDIRLSRVRVAENSPVGTLVGSLSSWDLDWNDAHTYSLVSGEGSEDNAVFKIDGNQVFTDEPIDYETQATYSIRVKSVDKEGLFFEKVLTVYVNNEREPIMRLSPLSGLTDVETGTAQPFSFTIYNDGELRLYVYDIIYPEGFDGNIPVYPISSGRSKLIEAVFSPFTAGNYGGVIRVESNAGEQLIELTARGLLVTGIDNGSLSSELLRVYPNPTSDRLIIDFSQLRSPLPLDIKMTDVRGVERFGKSDFRGDSLELDVSLFNSGLYFVHFTDGNSSIIKKVMIKR